MLEGAENAQSAAELCKLLGLSDVRVVTQAVEAERRAGAPICASSAPPCGYYLAESKEEFKRYICSLERRSGEIGKTLVACRETLKKWKDRQDAI